MLFILGIQLMFAAYLVVKWKNVAPPAGVRIERHKARARLIERGELPSPLSSQLLASDGRT